MRKKPDKLRIYAIERRSFISRKTTKYVYICDEHGRIIEKRIIHEDPDAKGEYYTAIITIKKK